MDEYDSGLLGGDSTWTVEQWHDYIRSELASAYSFYCSQLLEGELLSVDFVHPDCDERQMVLHVRTESGGVLVGNCKVLVVW